jgi:hypothetical protein
MFFVGFFNRKWHFFKGVNCPFFETKAKGRVENHLESELPEENRRFLSLGNQNHRETSYSPKHVLQKN